MTVSVVGYAKSGKTTLAVALTRAAVAQGFRVAAIKTGQHAPDAPHGSGRGGADGGVAEGGKAERGGAEGSGADSATPDSRRLAEAGARPALYWGPEGAVSEDALGVAAEAPLPSREAFGPTWKSLLRAPVVRDLVRADLLIIEGRLAPGAHTVMIRRGGSGGLKYPAREAQWIISAAVEHDRVIDDIMETLRKERQMPGKPTTKRRPREREVRLMVDGAEVKLNGFVKDVFQETIVGIVRALGTEDESKSIELTISEAPE